MGNIYVTVARYGIGKLQKALSFCIGFGMAWHGEVVNVQVLIKSKYRVKTS